MPCGPCVGCGATNYSNSMGGILICPACDCGATRTRRRTLSEELSGALSKSPADYVREERGRIREELREALLDLPLVASRDAGPALDRDDVLAALDRVCPE